METTTGWQGERERATAPIKANSGPYVMNLQPPWRGSVDHRSAAVLYSASLKTMEVEISPSRFS